MTAALALASCSSPPGEKPADAPAPDGEGEKPNHNGQGLLHFVKMTFWNGVEPPATAFEEFRAPVTLVAHVSALEWERGQVERFGRDRWFGLVKTQDGRTLAVHARGKHVRQCRGLTPARERILRRLYAAVAFEAAAPEALVARLAGPAPDAEAALERAAGAAVPAWDEATVARARKNLIAEGTRSAELARALEALADSQPAGDLCRAAVWLLSRMDGMMFARATAEGSTYDAAASIPDLKSVDARSFYENVFYAVKARLELPWGSDASEHDFLQHVLSPRGTAEPLQRWRRLYFEALLPELAACASRAEAQELASAAAADVFQYEGDTTWEDFGLLTALVVHEGRCEDCTNVETAFLRAAGIPAVQAFTPWWGAGDGNHAWTWIPGQPAREGHRAVKVFVKTWDGMEDVTDAHGKTGRLEVDASGGTGEPELHVWNHDEWRRICRGVIREGKAVFEKVGFHAALVLCVRVVGKPDTFVLAENDGAVRPLQAGAPGPGSVAVELENRPWVWDFTTAADVAVQTWADGRWTPVEFTRTSAGGVAFRGEPDRLYRLQGATVSGRPFTVAAAEPGKPAAVTIR